jgi:hypothetical protein
MALAHYTKLYDKFFDYARKIVGPSYRPKTLIGTIYHSIKRCKRFILWNVSTLLSFSPFFGSVQYVKPLSSRAESKEIYLVARGFKGRAG